MRRRRPYPVVQACGRRNLEGISTVAEVALRDLGECEVKHGLRLHLFNLYKDGLGNPQVPEKLRRGKRTTAKLPSASGHLAFRNGPRVALIVIALLVSASALLISSVIFFSRGPATATTDRSVPWQER